MYWLFLAVFETIKSVRLHLLEQLDPTTIKNSQYPSSDQFLDNVVLVCNISLSASMTLLMILFVKVGLYIVFFGVECSVLVLYRAGHKRLPQDETFKLRGFR